MSNETIEDAKSWVADSIDEASQWYHSLSGDCLQMLDDLVRALRAHPKPVQEIRLQDSLMGACVYCLAPVQEALVSGRGFAIVDRIPVEEYSLEEAQAAYWIIGQCLGKPFVQNIEGTVLYDVRDTGQDVKEGVRFSVTNAESSFHTDNAFSHQVPGIVGLLCVQTAKSGGQSQLVSAYALHHALIKEHREVLQTLYEPFYFDRRGQFLKGEESVRSAPVFRWDGNDLHMRYLNFYIQVGHQEAGIPLTSEQTRALEALENLLKQPAFRVTFDLKPGQMLFTNNEWILHNRTAFEDYEIFEQRRHYVRLWLNPMN
ncbi:MAG: TauD/TfdA family dioxygenase [bacterium]|nr:TauD/TfdA family dioxygenase [bacterium]